MRTMRDILKHGQPGSTKTMKEFCKRFYALKMTHRVQSYVDNYPMCIRTKSSKKSCIRTNLRPMQRPGYSFVLTACDVCSRYLFAEPLRKLDTTFVVCASMQIFTQHTYVPEHIITDKGTAFASQLMTDPMQASCIKINHATLKHAQTIGKVERTHQKLKQILKTTVTADTPQKHSWGR